MGIVRVRSVSAEFESRAADLLHGRRLHSVCAFHRVGACSVARLHCRVFQRLRQLVPRRDVARYAPCASAHLARASDQAGADQPQQLARRQPPLTDFYSP